MINEQHDALAEALYNAWNRRTAFQWKLEHWREVVGDDEVQALLSEGGERA